MVLLWVMGLDVDDSASDDGFDFVFPGFSISEACLSDWVGAVFDEPAVFERWGGLSFCSSVSSSELRLRRLDDVVGCFEKLRRVCFGMLIEVLRLVLGDSTRSFKSSQFFFWVSRVVQMKTS